jgi:hypothetical protein
VFEAFWSSSRSRDDDDETQRTWKMKVISIFAGATGSLSWAFHKYLHDGPVGKHSSIELQNTAIL